LTPEEAYQEGLRRIRECGKTGALELDLGAWKDGKYTVGSPVSSPSGPIGGNDVNASSASGEKSFTGLDFDPMSLTFPVHSAVAAPRGSRKFRREVDHRAASALLLREWAAPARSGSKGLRFATAPSGTKCSARRNLKNYVYFIARNTSPKAESALPRLNQWRKSSIGSARGWTKTAWNIIRDKTAMRHGDLISSFMKRIGLADHVIVVLSDKYLRSPYCMTELHSIYQRSVGEKEGFLHRIIPLVLLDARFGSPEERVEYAKHWEARYLKLKSNLDYLSVEDFRLYQDMKRWHLDVGNMLSYINDALVPHLFDEIVKDNFAKLCQILSERLMLIYTRRHSSRTPVTRRNLANTFIK
jgi:TIR domain